MSALIWLAIYVWAEYHGVTIPNEWLIIGLFAPLLFEAMWNGAYSRRTKGEK